MLSFINMGSRKKRQRKKSVRSISGNNARGNRRVSRGSGSFMSPGNLGDIIELPKVQPVAHGEAKKRSVVGGKRGATVTSSTEAIAAPKRSPEIQLEFNHDSLLQSLPREFLKHTKASASSIVTDVGAEKPSSSQAAEWTSNTEGGPQGRRLTQEKRRMAPLPSVAPIKIPGSPVQSIPARSQRRASRTRRSLVSNSAAWASDSEISPVSGLSAARDVIAESFSFSTRTTGFAESSGKERENGNRTARQDSATLPREAVWEGAVRSPSVSQKSSAHSMKKRRLDATAFDLPPFEALSLPTVFSRKEDGKENRKPETTDGGKSPVPPRKDSMLGLRREGPVRSPPPPSLTPSAMKLDHADQAALHRISRILETDAEASSMSLTQPGSGSTSGSFPSRSPRGVMPRMESRTLGSPFKVPSILSSPSTYSKYSVSPYSSPGKPPLPISAGLSSGRSDYGSFLEDYQFVGPSSSGPSSRGGRSGYSGSGDSPYDAQVPMTAASSSSMDGSKPASATGSSGFRRDSSKFSPLLKMRANATVGARRGKEIPSSIYPTPPDKAETSANQVFLREKSGNDSASFVAANKAECASAGGELTQKEVISTSNMSQGTDVASSNTVDHRKSSESRGFRALPNLKVGVSEPGKPDSEKRRPSHPRLRVSNPGPSLSPVSISTSPSSRSPDLLDMLIPYGHIVTPISRRQVGRKRSGSTPSPIKITPSRSFRYLPMNGDEIDEGGIIDVHERGLDGREGPRSALSTGDTQTFPETPVLFSPDIAKDGVSRSNSVLSVFKHPQSLSTLFWREGGPFQPIVIPSTPRVGETAKLVYAATEPNERPSTEIKPVAQITIDFNSPPISPLQLPPPSPVVPSSIVQELSDTVRPSPPLLDPAPRRRTVHSRPPLPFGPRKPNSQARKSTAPLSFAPRRTVSESAAGISNGLRNTKGQSNGSEALLSTPTFKTTPVAWRALTLDAAKWTFSSAQLQGIVRSAIEESAQSSSIRLLPPDIFEQVPTSLNELEARRSNIQNNYKVSVRRRNSIIQRLRSLSSSNPKVDISSVVRDAEELATVSTSSDRLVEELHDVDDQIAQITRLRDVHQASALAVALRKLNASLIRQTADTHRLQLDVSNLYGERNEAWRKAEELERELDAANTEVEVSRSKSVSSSRRSSRVSLARKSSSRTSKAGLRYSGISYHRSSQLLSGSSLFVHHSGSARSTFSSDFVPPVPPLPNHDPPVLTATRELLSSRTVTSMAHSSAMPSTADRMYNVVYDLLGVQGTDRALPSPMRPHSAVCYSSPPPSTDDIQRRNERPTNGMLAPPSHSESGTRLRSGSLPTLISPPQEAEETGAIIAMLDFHD